MQNKILIAITFLSIGLLIGLRQQHLQKDYMIKVLMNKDSVTQNVTNSPNLPKIGDLK